MIPLVDSLAHPTVTGKWLEQNLNSLFSSLVKDLKDNEFAFACAVGLAGIEGYSHESFIKECNKYNMLIPIAGFNLNTTKSPKEEIAYIKQLGYKGIKIHPRFSSVDLENNNLDQIFNLAADCGMIVFYCTYNYCDLKNYSTVDPFYSLVKILKKIPEAKVILIHGGDVQLLRYAELVRFNSNLLLDLSLTIMKYKDSSVDQDIQFLFNSFDERICIGTDHPEYSHAALRERFDYFSKNITKEKKENIAYKNLLNFLDLKELELEIKRKRMIPSV